MGEPIWLRAIRKSKGGARVIAKYQKPADPNAGERLPDFVHVTGNEYFRLDQMPLRSYVKCVAVGGGVSWWAKDPLGHVIVWEGSLVVEHEDRTITVEGVIANLGPYEPCWRGRLMRGIWTPVEGGSDVA